MANHKSSLKRIRSNDAKADRNRYQLKTTRTFIKKLRTSTDKKEAEALLIEVTSMIDKLAKKNIIHKNNAAHKKSKLTKLVSALGGKKTAAPADKAPATKKVTAAK
jgi:small subunit ribosomal protein S20